VGDTLVAPELERRAGEVVDLGARRVAQAARAVAAQCHRGLVYEVPAQLWDAAGVIADDVELAEVGERAGPLDLGAGPLHAADGEVEGRSLCGNREVVASGQAHDALPGTLVEAPEVYLAGVLSE